MTFEPVTVLGLPWWLEFGVGVAIGAVSLVILRWDGERRMSDRDLLEVAGESDDR